ncbi:MAG: nucleoside hydrolase [Clostridiales bacterium]|nr:nucleoside hydrolase [Clostridiales bacterium]
MLSNEQIIKMLNRPEGLVDMVLDTDTFNEIDDQYAISYAISAPERLRVKAFYAAPFFNERSTGPADGMEKSYHEIKKLLKLAGKEDYPVFRGPTSYLPDEKTPVASEAMEDLIRLAMTYTSEKPLYVVSIAAITNIASALLTRPEIAERIVVVWLGCHALHWEDNYEFNVRQDVAAARVVFDSGVPLVMLPAQGIVSNFATTGPELEYWLRGKNPLCEYLIDHTIEAANEYAKGHVWSRTIWDVTGIGWLMNDSKKQLMRDKIVPRPIPEYSHHLSWDFRRPPCRMVYHINRDGLFEDLFRHIAPEIRV